MQAAYSRYKDLKRLIRDQAGTDIQRLVRGFLCRRSGGPVRGDVRNCVHFDDIVLSGLIVVLLLWAAVWRGSHGVGAVVVGQRE